MATNIGNLKVNIGANTADLSRGIGRAKAMMRSFARVAKVSGIAAGVAFTAASVGMVRMSKSGLEFVDAQAKMARSVDGSIDGLRALQIAAGDAGASVEVINKAAQNMGKRLSEAARDGFGPAAEALEMLNLNASDLMEMDVDARFGAIADRVNELGMSAQQSADLMREFGVRNAEVALALLQGGAAIKAARQEVNKFGLSIGTDAAAAIERANDAMSRIGFVFEGLRNQLAVTVAPLLENIAVKFQDMAGVGGPLQIAVERVVASFGDLATVLVDPAFVTAAVTLGTTIAGAVSGLSKMMIFLIENAELAGSAMIALGAAMVWFSGPIGLAVAAVSAGVFLLSTRLGATSTAADEAALAEGRLMAALESVDRSNSAAVRSGKELIESHISQARAALEAARAELTLQQAQYQGALDSARYNAGMQPGNMFSGVEVSQAEQDLINATEFYSGQVKERQAQLKKYQEVLQGFTMSQFPSHGAPGVGSGEGGGAGVTPDPLGVQKLNEDLARLITIIDPAQAKTARFQEAMRLLTDAKQAGLITDDEYILRAKQINEVLNAAPGAASAAGAGLKALSKDLAKSGDVGKEMADDISGAVGNLITRIDSGKDALRNFGLELVKIFAVRGISKILGGSDWLTSSLIGTNALGTDNWRGGLSWVGERGPELVNLPRGAQVIPNSKLGSMGGGGSAGFVYAPKIDARGASLAAVQELDQRMRADAVQFNQKVVSAVQSARTKRAL